MVAGALALCLYGIAVTQTLSAVAAITAASALLWLRLVPGRRTMVALVAVALLAAATVAALPALRTRVVDKAAQLVDGDLNLALTGRLDGWRAAGWMLSRHPLAGVGQGAYSAEFAAAKLDLAERGTAFFRGAPRPMFANAHNDLLEVGAVGGLPGLAALGWGVWLLLAGLLRGAGAHPAPDRRADLALAWAGLDRAGGAGAVPLPVPRRPRRLPGDPLSGLVVPSRLGGWAVSGRGLCWLVAPLLAAALVGQTLRAGDLLEANRILHQVEQVSVLAGAATSRAAPLFWANLKLLQNAERLAPADSRLALARGSQFLLLDRPREAAAAYREALAVEARPEIYLNLGRALAAAGDRQAAAESFHRAETLAPWLSSRVPAELRRRSRREGQ